MNHAFAAKPLFLNVYLKLEPNDPLTTLISDFNHWISKQKTISPEIITPYLAHYPAHITLYLTYYQPNKLQDLYNIVGHIAQQNHPISVSATDIEVYPNAYMMLGIKNNTALYHLHASTVHLLSELRDKKTSIPTWAARNAQQQKSFTLYGSPGVLALYNPHISILQVTQTTPNQQQTTTVNTLKHLVHRYKQHHQLQQKTSVHVLALGIANEEGQIIKELASYPLI